MLRPLMMTAAVLSLALILTGCKDDHDSLMKKTVDKMNELASTLESVNDEASSKAAAPKIKAIAADLQELKKKADALPKPSAEEEKRLKDKYKKSLSEAGQKVFGQMGKFMTNPKLSTPELREALKSMQSIK
jgi:hypothetical protein